MKTSIVTGIIAFNVLVLNSQSALKGPFGPGKYALELEGGGTGFVQSVQGGDVYYESESPAASDFLTKRSTTVRYGDFTMQIGATMSKPVYDWISDTFDGLRPRKNGSVIAGDFNLKSRETAAFTDALISEVTVPACDAANCDPTSLTVKFLPSAVKWSASDSHGGILQNNSKQKTWSTCAFRLDIPGLECDRVSKIDAFTVKQTFTEILVGHSRAALIGGGKVEFPNLRVTVPAADAQKWLAWADEVLLKGNHGESQEKDGTLTFLNPARTEELVRVSFHNLGINRVHRLLSEETTGQRSIRFDLSVERMEIDFMAQFEK